MILYVAGPMTGLPELNYPAFRAAKKELEALGHVTNDPSEGPEQSSWEDYMRQGLITLLGCEGVALLDGWENSNGAQIEATLAHTLGMEVHTLYYWTNVHK